MPTTTQPRTTIADDLPAISDLPAPAYGEPPEAEIAAEAYALFEARGFEHGHDVEDWLAAESIVRQRRALLPPR